MLTYDGALAYLRQFINYETQQRVSYDPEHFNPKTFEDFLHTIGAPHEAFPSVLIAGSKGKGSTTVMVASILSRAGLRTGAFVKPHLVTVRERTQIDRQLISRDDFAALMTELRTHMEAAAPAQRARIRTFFELTTALSFLHFARQQVDCAVVEVGLGGRLDTTNVLTPRVAVITPIGLEHTRILGETLAAIAGEKAGIIKPHSCVVSAEQAPEVVEVLEARCRAQHATLLLAGRDFTWDIVEHTWQGSRIQFTGCGLQLADLHVALPGRHQAANAAVAVAVTAQLRQQGWTLPDDAIRQGLKHVEWEGRLEVIGHHPWVILDAAHTVESAQCLRQALSELFAYDRLHLVLGLSADKNFSGFVDILAPLAHDVIVTRASQPRAIAPPLLAQAVASHNVPVRTAPDPLTALDMARSAAQPADLICVTGSLLLLGDLKARQRGLPIEM
jgi:dihydrofolate synthase/folylpolyglutamate synthase